MRNQSSLNTPWFQGYSKAQWEIRFTNRTTSGERQHTPKDIDGLSNCEEYNKHNMGFKVEKKTEKNTILVEHTHLPDDMEIE